MCYQCGNCASGFHDYTVDDSMDKMEALGFLWTDVTNATMTLNTEFAIKKIAHASVKG